MCLGLCQACGYDWCLWLYLYDAYEIGKKNEWYSKYIIGIYYDVIKRFNEINDVLIC